MIDAYSSFFASLWHLLSDNTVPFFGISFASLFIGVAVASFAVGLIRFVLGVGGDK